jgi:hypothetical protein
MSDLTRKVFLAETAAVNQHLAGSSAVDQARAALQQFASVPGFVDAIERFEAAVRANERSGETRAAVLREGADAVDSGKQAFPETVRSGASWAARMLRRMADEAQQGADQ